MGGFNNFTDEEDFGSCLIVQPIIPNGVSSRRNLDEVMEEVDGLARAIQLRVSALYDCKVSRIHPGYFLTKGIRENVSALVEEHDPSLIIVNATLSPVQQRNLEREWKHKVIDRTGLILEIFGARAQTKEGRLQVELAAQEYQRSRLVRSWTHLERQRGGAGFMGGPGETQIELDRRIIGQRIVSLKKQIADVKRTRDLGRKSRERVPFPVVALVGYTNAGKSTLFNRMTGAGVFAEDLPFATLDPTLRKIALPNKQEVILSDTVGFIADLPTHLVAAFRATLEQTLHGDVLVHMIDVSKPDFEAQRQDVIAVLEDLGISYEEDERIIEVYNKIDALADTDMLAELERRAKVDDRLCLVSAYDGRGVDEMMRVIASVIGRARQELSIQLPVADGRALAWLYEHGEITQREDGESGINIRVFLDPANLGKFEDQYSYKIKRL